MFPLPGFSPCYQFYPKGDLVTLNDYLFLAGFDRDYMFSIIKGDQRCCGYLKYSDKVHFQQAGEEVFKIFTVRNGCLMQLEHRDHDLDLQPITRQWVEYPVMKKNKMFKKSKLVIQFNKGTPSTI